MWCHGSRIDGRYSMNKLSTDTIHRLCATPNSTLNVASYLTRLLASTLAGEPLRRIARMRCLVLSGVLCLANASPAEAMTNTDALKLYAHSRIINYEQFQCFHKLITAESSWRINARNGSHFGLGQMRNEKYRNLDGFRQIDWSIRYNITRYGSHCNTWRFFEKHGYH
jgi:hypothetical protein